MFSLPFLLNPPPQAATPICLTHLLVRKHHTLEVGKELIHCAYLALLFVYQVSSIKWYLYTALPMLAFSILCLITQKGGN